MYVGGYLHSYSWQDSAIHVRGYLLLLALIRAFDDARSDTVDLAVLLNSSKLSCRVSKVGTQLVAS